VQFKQIWSTLPNFVCWDVSLTKNGGIFEDKVATPRGISLNTQSMLSEFHESRQNKALRDRNLAKLEKYRYTQMIRHMRHIPISTSVRQKSRPNWKLRLSYSYFNQWRAQLPQILVIFDRASKGNPGEDGAGGVLCGPGGIVQITYTCGLDKVTRN